MAAVTMDVSELVQQMNDNLASIHATIAGLSTKDHETKLDELEQKRDTLLSDLKNEYDTEREELAAKRKQEEEEIAEQRRKEDEEREARRKKEDEELLDRINAQDAERQGKYDDETKRVEDEADEGMDGVEEEVRKLFEEGQAKLAELEEKRKEINRLIDEQMNTPLPTIVPRKRARDKAAETPAPADPPADAPADAPTEASAKEEEPTDAAASEASADPANAVVDAKADEAPPADAAPETNGEKPEETVPADAKADDAPADDVKENKENSKSEVSSSLSYEFDELGSNKIKANDESAAPAPEADEGDAANAAPVPPLADDRTNDDEKDPKEKEVEEEEMKEEGIQADELEANKAAPVAPTESCPSAEKEEGSADPGSSIRALNIEEEPSEEGLATKQAKADAPGDVTQDSPEQNDAEEEDEELPDYYNTTSPTFTNTDTSPVPNDNFELSPAAEESGKTDDVAEVTETSGSGNELVPDESSQLEETASEVAAAPVEKDNVAEDSEQSKEGATLEDVTAKPENDTATAPGAEGDEPPTDQPATPVTEDQNPTNNDPESQKSESGAELGEELPVNEPTATSDVNAESQDLDTADHQAKEQGADNVSADQPEDAKSESPEDGVGNKADELSMEDLAVEAPTHHSAENIAKEDLLDSKESMDDTTADDSVVKDLSASEESTSQENAEMFTKEISPDEPLAQEPMIESFASESLALPASSGEEVADVPVPGSTETAESKETGEGSESETENAQQQKLGDASLENETRRESLDKPSEAMAAASASPVSNAVANDEAMPPVQNDPEPEIIVNQPPSEDLPVEAESKANPQDETEKSLNDGAGAHNDEVDVNVSPPNEAPEKTSPSSDELAQLPTTEEDQDPSEMTADNTIDVQTSAKEELGDEDDVTVKPMEAPEVSLNSVTDKDEHISSDQTEKVQQIEEAAEMSALDAVPQESSVDEAQPTPASAETAKEPLHSAKAVEDEGTNDVETIEPDSPADSAPNSPSESPLNVDGANTSVPEGAEPLTTKQVDNAEVEDETCSPIQPDTVDSQVTLVETVTSPTNVKGADQVMLSPPPSESGSSTPDEESFLGTRGGGGSDDGASLVAEKRHDIEKVSPSPGEDEAQPPTSDAAHLPSTGTEDELSGGPVDSQPDPAKDDNSFGEAIESLGVVKDQVDAADSTTDDSVAPTSTVEEATGNPLPDAAVASPEDKAQTPEPEVAEKLDTAFDQVFTSEMVAKGVDEGPDRIEPLERSPSPQELNDQVRDLTPGKETLADSDIDETPADAQPNTRGLPSAKDDDNNIQESPMSSPLIESPYDLEELVAEDFTTKRPLSPLPEDEDEEDPKTIFMDDATTLVGGSKEKGEAPNRTFRGHMDEPEPQTEKETEEVSLSSAPRRPSPEPEIASLQPHKDTALSTEAFNPTVDTKQPNSTDVWPSENSRDAGEIAAKRDEMASAGVGLETEKAADYASGTDSDSESEYERNAARVREEELWLRETYGVGNGSFHQSSASVASDERDIHPALRSQTRASEYRNSYVTGLPAGFNTWSRELSEEPGQRGLGQPSSEEGGAVLEAPKVDLRDTNRSWTPEDSPPPAASPSRAWMSDTKPVSGTPSQAWARLGGQDNEPYEERYGGLPSARLADPAASASTRSHLAQSRRSEYTYDSDSDEVSDWGTQDQHEDEGHRNSNGSQESQFDGYVKERTIRIVDDGDDAPRTAVLTPQASHPTPTLAPQSARRDPEPSPLQLRHQPSFDVPIPPKSPLRSIVPNPKSLSRPQTPTKAAPEPQLEPEMDPELFVPRDVTNVPWHARNDSVPISLRSQSTLSSTPSSPVHSALHVDRHEPVIRDSWPRRPRNDSVLTDRTTGSDYDAFRYDAIQKGFNPNTPSGNNGHRWSAQPSTSATAANNSPGSIFQKMRNIFENQTTPAQHPQGHNTRANESGSPTRSRPVSGVWVPVRQSRAYSNSAAQAPPGSEWEGDYGDGQRRRGGFLNEAPDDIDERSALLRSGASGLEAN